MLKKLELAPEEYVFENIVYKLLAANARGESVYTNFMGYYLFSDLISSVDDAYLEIFKVTKNEFEKTDKNEKQQDVLPVEAKKLEVVIGSNIESIAYDLLAAKSRKEYVYCVINGKQIYSNEISSLNDVYLKVLGKETIEQEELNRVKAIYKAKLLKEHRDKMNAVKAKISDWLLRGKEMIFPQRHKEWEKYVMDSVNSPYYGDDIEHVLEAISLLQTNLSIKYIKTIIESNISDLKTRLLIREKVLLFSNRGPEYWSETIHREMSLEEKEMLETKKAENILFKRLNNPEVEVKPNFKL